MDAHKIGELAQRILIVTERTIRLSFLEKQIPEREIKCCTRLGSNGCCKLLNRRIDLSLLEQGDKRLEHGRFFFGDIRLNVLDDTVSTHEAIEEPLTGPVFRGKREYLALSRNG